MGRAHELVEVRMKIKAEKIDEGVDESGMGGQELVQMVDPHGQEQLVSNEHAKAQGMVEEGVPDDEQERGALAVGAVSAPATTTGATTSSTRMSARVSSLSERHGHGTQSSSAPSSPLQILQQSRRPKSGGEQSGYTSDQLKSWLRNRSSTRKTAAVAVTKSAAGARPQGEEGGAGSMPPPPPPSS
jgi:hypothetical protein